MPEKPIVLNEATDSAPLVDLHELWRYRALLYFLTWRDIKVRSAAWAIIQPLGTMLVFALFFGLWIRGRYFLPWPTTLSLMHHV